MLSFAGILATAKSSMKIKNILLLLTQLKILCAYFDSKEIFLLVLLLKYGLLLKYINGFKLYLKLHIYSVNKFLSLREPCLKTKLKLFK